MLSSEPAAQSSDKAVKERDDRRSVPVVGTAKGHMNSKHEKGQQPEDGMPAGMVDRMVVAVRGGLLFRALAPESDRLQDRDKRG